MANFPANHSRFSEFKSGFRDTFPLVVGAIPFGIIFGTLSESGGLSIWEAIAFSSIVFAGSSQFIALGMVASGTAWPMIVLTTFVVNLRHMLYSTSLLPHVRNLSQKWRIPLSFWLTDETFAVVIRRYGQLDDSPNKHWYFLGSSIFMYSNWQLCTLIGLFFGRAIPGITDWGLDFAMSATFIGIIVPYLKNRPTIAACVVAGILGVLLNGVPNKIGLIIATLAGITTGYFLQSRISAANPKITSQSEKA